MGSLFAQCFRISYDFTLRIIMDALLFFRGLVIGFCIAAPVGPIGVLCIRRTLVQGQWVGLLTGLGAATADAMYGAIAGFGLTFISTVLVDQAGWLQLIGGLFLCCLGVKILLDKPASEAASATGQTMIGAYLSTVVLTLTNPATILSFVAVFAGLGLASTQYDYGAAAVLVVGVFLGSALWWLLLSGGVSLLRHRFALKHLHWLNRVSGIVIFIFGILALSFRG
jgi:threonine/homoserine/homoserine lactone efflux protein